MKTDEPLPLACPDCGAVMVYPGDDYAGYKCGRFIAQKYQRLERPCKKPKAEPTPEPLPAKPTEELPRHCPHCGVKTETPSGRYYGTYSCGLYLGRESLKDHPEERSPCCAVKPAPEPPFAVRMTNAPQWVVEPKTRTEAEQMASYETTPQNPPTEQNTMTTAQNTSCEIQPLPTPGSKWAYETNTGTHIGVIESCGPSGIYVKGKKSHGIFTHGEWNCLTRTQLPSKHDAIRIPSRGASRIKWFTIGAAACFFGKPFLPDLISAISGYVTRLM